MTELARQRPTPDGETAAGNGQGTARAAAPGIVTSRLSKDFGTVRAVDDLSFTVEHGTVTGFLGPNGAGKTTTLRMILGLATPSAGAATIGGARYADLADPARTVGAVLEATSFHPARTARNHLRVFCAAAGVADRRADEVLEVVGLSGAARVPVGRFSLGMRQRLSLATALIGDPRVLILDEPANGLDPQGIAWLRQLLRYMADAEGRTILISSHVLSEVEQIVDRVVIIARGRLLYEGTLRDLPGGQSAVVVRTPAVEAATAALAAQGAAVSDRGSGWLLVTGISAAAAGHACWQANVELHELRDEGSTLEQRFLALTADPGPPGAPA
ncbi:MAG: ABC transporter ATP-binding protein [Candidatus Dormibacteria bacterium]|jgi:ABC-2 type transport system ATP-binding protein